MSRKSVIDDLAAIKYRGLTFSQLNELYDDLAEDGYLSEPYEDYFDVMDIPDDSKKRRQESADNLERIFRDLLALVFYLYSDGAFDYSTAVREAQDKYKKYVDDVMTTDRTNRNRKTSGFFTDVHIPTTVTGIVNTTLKNPDNLFNFSIDRARMIAENEANSMWNDAEFEEAVLSGMTSKTWHTIIDRNTRDWHAEVNGQTKPILEPFDVDGELLMFPRDESWGCGPGNVVNCRCSASYS